MPVIVPYCRKPQSVRLPQGRRPSILDPFTNGDPWIKGCETEHSVVVYLQGQPIAVLAAMPFDIVSLYQRLFELRRRLGAGRRF